MINTMINTMLVVVVIVGLLLAVRSSVRPSRIITLPYRISLFRNDSGLSASLPLPHSHNHRKAVK